MTQHRGLEILCNPELMMPKNEKMPGGESRAPMCPAAEARVVPLSPRLRCPRASAWSIANCAHLAYARAQARRSLTATVATLSTAHSSAFGSSRTTRTT